MKPTDRELNNMLQDLTDEIRAEKLDSGIVDGAAHRVWARLSGEKAAEAAGVETSELMVGQLRGCDDFQALIPAYLAGALSSARTMLLEDHTRECVPCRKALKVARHGNQTVKQLEVQKARAATKGYQMTVLRWGIAAVLVAGLGLFAWPSVQRLMNSYSTLNAIVEAANGGVYKITDTRTQAVRSGEKIRQGERIRTAKDAGAVIKLSDGTRVELRERAEVSVVDNPSGVTINLDRGQVIVEAAKQRDRKLYVQTDDSLVSVTGTIFSVNSGAKGSRVSVVEGEVHVDHAGKDTALHAGQQTTTHESIERIRVKDEIAWSRDSDRYIKMLDEARAQIDAAVAMPGNRYSTHLLDLMPADTTFYVAIPNLSETLTRANQILQDNIQQNAELRTWWQHEQQASKPQAAVQGAIKQVSEFGRYLGQEIVIGGNPEAPIVLAELNDAAGFRNYLEQQAATLTANSTQKSPIQIIDDPTSLNATAKSVAGASKRDQGLKVWINGNLLAASPDAGTLRTLAASGASGGAFASNPFHTRLAEIYKEGAGFLIAADLEKIVGSKLSREIQSDKGGREAATLNQLGISGLRYFIVEIKEKDGKPYNRAVVSFKENQRGVTSWLAAPGPMGALEFISPDANVVASFVVKEPTALVDDVLGALKTADPDAWEKLLAFQQEQSVDLRSDLAEPLGGEYAFALDGPVLPIPSWKAVFQVSDQQRLQQTIDRFVEKLNAEMLKNGKRGISATRAESGDRTFFTIKSLDVNLLEIDYTFAYGYLIAAPSRALVENAIKYKESGYTVLQSPKFKASLPEDQQTNFSAMVYQNVASLVAPVQKVVGGANVPKEGREMLKGLLGKKAGLAYVYALNDRMVFSVNTEDGPLGINASDLLGMPGSSGLGHILKSATH
jgi:hypothetical protein